MRDNPFLIWFVGVLSVFFLVLFMSDRKGVRIESNGANVAKMVGGTGSITLPPRTKLVLMTWKGNDAWVLTRPFRDGEKAEEYTYQESSTFGVMQATIKIKEQE